MFSAAILNIGAGRRTHVLVAPLGSIRAPFQSLALAVPLTVLAVPSILGTNKLSAILAVLDLS